VRSSELAFETLPPLALYVHLPWCVRKCPYCDFNSFEAQRVLPDEPYVDALLRDLAAEAESTAGRSVESVYFGGGTPSLFSAPAMARLLEGIVARVPVAPDAEVTLEANPGAVDASRFAAFRAAGVNRLSIGVQSFRDPALRALGRVHDGTRAREAIELARAAGFENFNVDLMYGLPGDDARGAVADLQAALALAPPHLSRYQLTLEPNTAFARRPPRLPDADTVAAMEEDGRSLLALHGLPRYEISAYAPPERRSRHNRNYWQFGDYLGIGAGAHGKVTLCDERAIERRAKTRNPRTYMETAGSPPATACERITLASQAAIEFLMNGLRLIDGVPEELFVARAGQPLERIAKARAAGVARGWLAAEPGRLRATSTGLDMLNRLLALFA
jgi:putative oxygen-independent coproporphyrinogen III oxidase